ncbi:hypothetical protein Tco_1015403 [Tanacetum coccineum]|uniref:Uncharacterized protein n=1 Tax=Tanacetum coccineum TaxID=301880 RepID=A0ABQ5FLT7_9ASTR
MRCDFGGVTDWYKSLGYSELDPPLSPDNVVDFPIAEPKPESEQAFDFFAAGPVLGLADAPRNMNGWLEEDESLGVEADVSTREQDEDMDVFMEDDEGEEFNDDEDSDWEVDNEWTMAPVTPLIVALPPPYPMGLVDQLVLHLDYRIRLDDHYLRKLGDVNDAQLDDGIAIGEIRPRVTTLEGKVDGLRKDVDGLLGREPEVKTLKSTMQRLEEENQQLRYRLTAGKTDQGVLISYVLWMEKCLTSVEQQLQGPPPGF